MLPTNLGPIPARSEPSTPVQGMWHTPQLPVPVPPPQVCIRKQKGEILGIAIVESGWGSILPTVVIANLMHGGPAERSGELSIGDRLMSINGTSLVGLPLTTCQSIIRVSWGRAWGAPCSARDGKQLGGVWGVSDGGAEGQEGLCLSCADPQPSLEQHSSVLSQPLQVTLLILTHPPSLSRS